MTSDVDQSVGATTSKQFTVIVALWRYRLRLGSQRRGLGPPHRLIVVGPADALLNEESADVFYQVDGPITSRDMNFGALISKVRELCASTSSSQRRICVFERALQADIAQIRTEMGIAGLTPDAYEQLMHRKSKAVCRRGGLSTLKFCSLGSVQGRNDAEWLECARSNVGSYPMFLRPACGSGNCMHTLEIVRNPNELRSWMRSRPKAPADYVEYLAEECLERGFEFVALVSTRVGLLGIFVAIDSAYTFFLAVRRQVPYAIEWLDASQTRDAYPGLETFANQCMRSLTRATATVLYLKGFYKGHNSISFIGASADLSKQTLASLYASANAGRTYESAIIDDLFEYDDEMANSDSCSTNGGYSSAFTAPMREAAYHAVINFAHVEGVLLHQSSITRCRSLRRVVWRVAEGYEMLDADSVDDNVLQLFLSNSDRTALHADVKTLCGAVNLPIDKLSLLSRAAADAGSCRRVRIESARVERTPSSNNQLFRSFTTTD